MPVRASLIQQISETSRRLASVSLSPSLFSFLLFHPIYIAIIRNVNLISQLKTKLVTTYLRRTPRVSRSRRKNLHKSWFIREGMKNDMNKNNVTRESNAKRGFVDVGWLSESCCQQRNCIRWQIYALRIYRVDTTQIYHHQRNQSDSRWSGSHKLIWWQIRLRACVVLRGTSKV